MASPTLHIFIVHTESLTQRAIRLHGTVQTLRTLAQDVGYTVKPFFVLNPTAADITAAQDSYQNRINYDPTGVTELDNQRKILSVEILSNIEKHVKAWSMIADTASASDKDLFLVIEDDVCMLPMNVKNYVELLKIFAGDTSVPVWDLLFTGIAPQSRSVSEIGFENTRDQGNIITNKEAYFITPSTAKRLLSDFATVIKFSMRLQLSWYMHNHTDLRVYNTNKQVTLDGSKLGITPTTLHEANYLLYNAEFVHLTAFLNKTSSEIKAQIATINKIYSDIEHLKNPNIMHVYCLILHKGGFHEKLSEIMTTAIEALQNQQGLLNSRTEMLNNFIDMCKDLQPDLSLLKAKSKYLGMASAE
jgi:hypothetical protein